MKLLWKTFGRVFQIETVRLSVKVELCTRKAPGVSRNSLAQTRGVFL
jgi:hypothetical protein